VTIRRAPAPRRGRNKSERHAELLTENWRRFAHKWGLDEDERDKNDARLAPILQRQWPSAHLRIPIDTSAGQLPLLPQQTTPNTMSPRP
jgi:hypothetical protein